MKIELVCVGKLKEKYLVQAIDEYSKRLSRYCKLNIIELADEKTPDNASEKEELMIKDKEGEKILSKISDSAYVVALDLGGKMISSEELAAFMADCGVRGNSHIVFVIGGSLGLSDAVKARANYKLCFSKMTFPHQLFRVMLLEQVYRGFRINNNEPYHK
nr:23S rRNA (pseudouridine(1915)-N(3))-methyltransferase RlmH [uncultured Cellulosilyticum sp.]